MLLIALHCKINCLKCKTENAKMSFAHPNIIWTRSSSRVILSCAENPKISESIFGECKNIMKNDVGSCLNRTQCACPSNVRTDTFDRLFGNQNEFMCYRKALPLSFGSMNSDCNENIDKISTDIVKLCENDYDDDNERCQTNDDRGDVHVDLK